MGCMINPYRFAAAQATDPYRSSVKLLVGFNGANNSTTFTDESPVARTLTTNGNAKVTTAASMFGGASGAFDGTGDFLSAADSTDWQFAVSEFTVEGWFRFLVKQDSQALIGQWDVGGILTNCAWFFYITGGKLRLRTAASSTAVDTDAAWAPTLGQWYHLAACRASDNTLRVFVDGVLLASNNNPSATNNSTAPLTLGRIGTGTTFSAFDFNGNMDEVMVTNGAARYTSDSGFTVPAAAYPRS